MLHIAPGWVTRIFNKPTTGTISIDIRNKRRYIYRHMHAHMQRPHIYSASSALFKYRPSHAHINDLRPSHTHIHDVGPSHTHMHVVGPSHTHMHDLRPSYMHDLRPSHTHMHDLRPSHTHMHDVRPSHTHMHDVRPSHTHMHDVGPSHTHMHDARDTSGSDGFKYCFSFCKYKKYVSSVSYVK